jgi:hypothetical protein
MRLYKLANGNIFKKRMASLGCKWRTGWAQTNGGEEREKELEAQRKVGRSE